MSLNRENTEKVDVKLDVITGERGFPEEVSSRRSKNKLPAMIFVVVMTLVLGTYGYFSFLKPEPEPPKKEASRTIAESNVTVDMTLGADTKPTETKSAPKTDEKEKEKEKAAADNAKIIREPEKPVPVIDPSRAGLMVKAGSASGSSSAKSTNQTKAVQAPASSSLSGTTGLSAKLMGTQTARVNASSIGNRNYILAKGAVINCSLQTRIDTSVPGFVSCVTTRHTYSDNGKLLLIERGSQITGEYQNSVDEGSKRLFILWTRVKTPNGVVVDLGSPATDPLGGAGASGYVDTRFWTRFGNALLLSIVNQAFSTAAQAGSIALAERLNGGNNNNSNDSNDSGNNNNKSGINVDIGSMTSPMNDIISAVIQKSIDIPPIFYKNQGEKISIFVARDLDFSGVYDVKTEE